MARRLGILAGAILLLGVGAVIALKVIFTPEKLRALVVPRLEAAAGRDVELASIRLRIFPRIAIRLNDVAIANPPGFASDRALRLGALELQVRLRPLLKRQLELGRVRLLRPEIHYEVLADGTNNFEGLGAAGAGGAGGAAAGGAGGASAVAGLLVSNLVIDDGRIEYSDALTGRSASFRIDARLTAQRSDASARALESSGWLEISQLRARLSDDPADTVALSEARLEFDLLADFAGDSLRLREAKLRLGELPLEGSGVVRSLGGARELEFAFASGAVEISRLLAAVPGDRFSGYDIGGSIELSLQIGGSLAGEGGIIWSGLAKLENVSSGYGGISDFLSDGNGTISFASEEITLHQFEARVLSRPFQADLTVSGFDDPLIEGRLEGEFDLASVERLKEGTQTQMSGTLSFTIGLSGPIERREELRLRGPIRLSGVTYLSEKLPAPARVDGTVDLTGAGVSITDMAIAMGNSDFTLSLESDDLLAAALATDAPTHVPSLRFSLRSERFDLGEFPRDTASLGYASLVAARLAGRQLGGRDPSQIALEKYKGIALPPVNAHGRVRVTELVNPPNDASDIAFDVEFVDGVLQLKNLRARLYGGDASGSFSLDASGGSAPFPITYALKLEDARAGAFLDRWTRLGEAVSGRMDFEIAGSTTLDESLLPQPDAIEARGNTVFKDGRFLDLGPANALIDRFKLQDRISDAFQYLGGPFRIENGRFLLDAWRLTAGELKATIDGAAGLGGSLDLNLGIDVPRTALLEAGLLNDQSPLGGLLGQLAGDDGAIRLSLGIGGTMSQPQLRLDTESLEAALRNRLQDAGRGLLDRLLKKKN